jgi:hypothetical protein
VEALRIPPGMDIATENVLTAVPVRRPKRDEFFRVHAGDDYTADFLIVERDTDLDRETYLVTPGCADAVLEVARKVRLFTCISRRGTVFLWPAKLPADGAGSGHLWADSALRIAGHARTVWVRMWGDRSLGAYRVVKANGNLEEPKWPDKEYRDLLRMAFEARLIDRPDHPVIRELAGDL